MSYQRRDHAGWVESNNVATNRQMAKRRGWKPLPEKLNLFQSKVADILGMVGGGIYNAPINHAKVDWGGEHQDHWQRVSCTWDREMATWDFYQLTLLVFLCHEARIRCAVESAGPKRLRLSFHPRKAEGGMAERHPSLDEAVALFREYLPEDHRIRYEQTPKVVCIVCAKSPTPGWMQMEGHDGEACSACNAPVPADAPLPGLEDDWKERAMQLKVQLAGCAGAAHGATKDPATEGMYGWSPAYQDVLDLWGRMVRAEALNKQMCCSYCGHTESTESYEPEELKRRIAEHIVVCEKHPLKSIVAALGGVRNLLLGVIDQLDDIEVATRTAGTDYGMPAVAEQAHQGRRSLRAAISIIDCDVPAAPFDPDWIGLNRERGELVDRSIAGCLSEADTVRLTYLNGYADAHIALAAPRDDSKLVALETKLGIRFDPTVPVSAKSIP